MARRPNPLLRLRPVLRFLPNLMTVTALVAGLMAIFSAARGDFATAALLVIAAAALDGLDGRVARSLGYSSDFGAELDSLADFVNFGVTPAVILVLWAYPDGGWLGWAGAIFYAICCMMRLARFNVAAKAQVPGAAKAGFTGVPSPGGAALVLLPLFLSLAERGTLRFGPLEVTFWTIAVGLLMISRLPTPALSGGRMGRSRKLVLGVSAATLMALFPFVMMVALDMLYLLVLGRALVREGLPALVGWRTR